MTSRLMRFTAAAWLLLWLDLSLGHVSAGFPHPAMWLPFLLLPVTAGVAWAAACRPSAWWTRLVRVTSYGAILLGLLGFLFHLLRLVHDVKGAISWQVLVRLVRYPPLLAPLAITGVGLLGLLASHPAVEERAAKP